MNWKGYGRKHNSSVSMQIYVTLLWMFGFIARQAMYSSVEYITCCLLSVPGSESEAEINNDHGMMTVTNLVANLNVNMNVNTAVAVPDRLQFHERCGTLVKLSCNNRTAERRRPLDEFNNGVVMTHRPLRENELFEASYRFQY